MGCAVREQPKARPFIKYTGGKTQLLPKLLDHVPRFTGSYIEPFMGGAALFWKLSNEGHTGTSPVLNDANSRLVRTYRVVRDDVDSLIEALEEYRVRHHLAGRVFYEAVRAKFTDDLDDLSLAARLIYLNKTGFNGLYRVNSKGKYNVPFGDYERPRILNAELLRECSEALRSADIRVGDFEDAMKHAEAGDFVYADPPYLPKSKTANFTAFDKGGFTFNDHERLRDAAIACADRGVHVVLSNADVPAARNLYDITRGNGTSVEALFEIRRVMARRNVNSKGDRRGGVGELIIIASPR